MVAVIDFQQSYTFSKIFDLKIRANDLAEAFGYQLYRQSLNHWDNLAVCPARSDGTTD